MWRNGSLVEGVGSLVIGFGTFEGENGTFEGESGTLARKPLLIELSSRHLSN